MDSERSCKDCPERHQFCHDTCKDYLGRKEKRDDVNKKRRAANESHGAFIEHVYRTNKRSKNKK